MLILLPALLLILYGYALSFDVRHVRVGVLDLDRTMQSRAFLDGLFQNAYFDRVCTLSRVGEADGLLDRGFVRAVLVVPRGYAAGLLRGADVKVQFLVDGSDPRAGLTTIGYMDAMTDRVTRQQAEAAAMAAGVSPALPMVVPEPRVWFNPELVSARFLVPGLIALLLMLAAVVSTAMSIVREKERETMEQMMVSPLRPAELIMGKLLPHVCICLVTMAIVLVLGYVLFDVVVRGSFLVLGLATLLFLFAALGLGVLISSVTHSQRVAFEVAIISSLLPSVVLSGLIFPISSMPLPIQLVTLLVIPRYFVTALRAIILKGASFGQVLPQLVGLLALGILVNVVAAYRTRKSV